MGFTEKQKEFIESACQIQIENLAELGATKRGIRLIKDKLIDFHANDDTGPVEIRIQVMENIKVFKEIKKDPNTLFKQKAEHITLIANILAEFFDDEWEKEEFDDDFEGLIKKIMLHDEINQTDNLN
jgi:hypothetical protein